jgi:hypothetical protein
MTGFNKYAGRGKSKKDFYTEWAFKEGVFKTPQGLWIARVKIKRGQYKTLSQHRYKAIAERKYREFYQNDK